MDSVDAANHYAAPADPPRAETVFRVQVAYEKLIEAPWLIQETNPPVVLFLAARGDVVSDGFNLLRPRSDLSYRDAGAFDSFAQRAHVVVEYPTDALPVDDYLGLEIQFDSLGDELDEYPFTEAQEKRLLVLVGYEIKSAWSAQWIHPSSVCKALKMGARRAVLTPS